MEKLPRKRPSGHTDPMAMVAEHLPGLIVDRINLFIHDLLDQMDGATGGMFNLDDLADRLYGTERGLQTNVPRLDNRIDQIVLENMQAQLATYSSTDWWHKPTDAKFVRVVVIGAASGGGRGNNGGNGGYGRGGRGGYSGGWAIYEFDAADVPASVLCTVGNGGAGATTDGGHGADGGLSSFGDLIAATGGSSINQTYGAAVDPLHEFTFHIRGGNGASLAIAGGNGVPKPGGDGPFAPGAPIANELATGSDGLPGVSALVGQLGLGSAGSGGNGKNGAGNGGNGGPGGWPGAPGGGGGHYEIGFAGNGGNGAGGAIFVTSRFY